MSADDREYMLLAIAEARKCKPEDQRSHPFVGAVVVKDSKIVATAFRGELNAGEHAEYTALEKKAGTALLAGATVYTTLEPCTRRNEPKLACAERLIERKVARVVIGMLDPNPAITGKGQRRLRVANIRTDLFPSDLMAEVEELNRVFARAQKTQGSPADSASSRSSATPRFAAQSSALEVEELSPNVVPVMTHARRVHFDHSARDIRPGDGTRFDTPYTALVIPFRNEPTAVRVGDAYDVKARIAVGNGIYPVTGYWMQSDRDHISIPVGSSARELLVALQDRDGVIHAVNDCRDENNYCPPEILAFWTPTMPTEPFPVSIQLSSNGIVISETRYTLSLRPLELVPASDRP
jgi:pyrimidine deaminase RibD-like protein